MFAVVVVVEVLGSLGRIGRAAETFVDGAVDERADGGRRRGRRRFQAEMSRSVLELHDAATRKAAVKKPFHPLSTFNEILSCHDIK